nr:MAG TPA: hypothetical protein [Bacteriophage sp.]
MIQLESVILLISVKTIRIPKPSLCHKCSPKLEKSFVNNSISV